MQKLTYLQVSLTQFLNYLQSVVVAVLSYVILEPNESCGSAPFFKRLKLRSTVLCTMYKYDYFNMFLYLYIYLIYVNVLIYIQQLSSIVPHTIYKYIFSFFKRIINFIYITYLLPFLTLRKTDYFDIICMYIYIYYLPSQLPHFVRRSGTRDRLLNMLFCSIFSPF